MIKKIIVMAILCMSPGIIVKAQSIEIIPQVNYTFGGKIYSRFGELKIRNSESYGLSLDFGNKDVSFQIEYFYQPTIGVYRDYFNSDFNQSSDLNVSWYQIGVRRKFKVNDQVVPFGGASLGLTHFVMESSPNRYDEQALSFALQVGTNFYFSDRIGIRVHARLLSPIQFNGFGFYAGTGGAGATASAGSYFVQADFGAGLIIRIPR